MGLLDSALKRLQRAGASAASGRSGTPAATPDLDALVTGAELEAVTGSRPAGEPRRNGPDGSEVDIGRIVIKETRLADGGKFLISLNNCSDAAAAQLAMNRVAELEKPLEGVGERGLKRVDGPGDVGVMALKGTFTLSLNHSSPDGRADIDALTDLLRRALDRL